VRGIEVAHGEYRVIDALDIFSHSPASG